MRDVAPAEPGFEHERVEAVGLGEPAEQGQQRRLDLRLRCSSMSMAPPRGALQRHVVQPDRRAVRRRPAATR